MGNLAMFLVGERERTDPSRSRCGLRSRPELRYALTVPGVWFGHPGLSPCSP